MLATLARVLPRSQSPAPYVIEKPSRIERMSSFAAVLQTLAPVDDIQRLELLDDAGEVCGVIENKPGQAGSLAVYCHLVRKHERIDAAAATEGLGLYAEHTADARAHPGRHPNIDRLIGIAGGAAGLRGRIVPRS